MWKKKYIIIKLRIVHLKFNNNSLTELKRINYSQFDFNKTFDLYINYTTPSHSYLV